MEIIVVYGFGLTFLGLLLGYWLDRRSKRHNEPK